MITVNTATLKQQLSHYLSLAREGKDVLITNHKRIIARLLGEDEGAGRLPLREPVRDTSVLNEIGGFGFAEDPREAMLKERNAR